MSKLHRRIGTLTRNGETVHYITDANGFHREGDPEDLLQMINRELVESVIETRRASRAPSTGG